MDDRSEFQAFALEFRRKAQTAGSPVAREIWNMVADRWMMEAARGERAGGRAADRVNARRGGGARAAPGVGLIGRSRWRDGRGGTTSPA